MKKNFILLLLSFVIIILGFTNCTKADDTSDTEFFTKQAMPDIKTAIIGSWQIYEQEVEGVVEHDELTCMGNSNNTEAAHTSTTVQWEKASSFEQRDFKINGNYTYYTKSDLNF